MSNFILLPRFDDEPIIVNIAHIRSVAPGDYGSIDVFLVGVDGPVTCKGVTFADMVEALNAYGVLPKRKATCNNS